MPEVVKYEGREPKNMEMSLEALRKGDIGLNAATCGYRLRKYTGRDTWMGKKIILKWKTFKLLPKGNWLTVFTI